MKRTLYTTAIAAICFVATAQDAPPPPPPPPTPAVLTADAQITTDTATAQDSISAAQAEADKQVKAMSKQAHELAGKAQAMARREVQVAQAFADGSLDEDMKKLQANIQNNIAINLNGNRPERGLVLCSSAPDPKVIAAGQEDLSIMARLLEKNLAHPTDDDDDQKAMGIRVFNFGNANETKNFLIDGYGAIFMLNVNFPLAGPAEKTNDADVKERTNSPWDETKHELYGEPSYGHSVSVRRDFDPEKVEILKKSLIGALKYAANIRNLKSDESVTIVVNSENGGRYGIRTERKLTRLDPTMSGGGGGGSGGSSSSRSGGGGGAGMSWVAAEPNASHSGPVLTIRAKKSDIDAFAKGKLNFEEFRNKTAVLLY